jgi:hypothetical protein
MPRMIDLIKNSAVPSATMRTASKGALDVPPEEMIEILVYLASHPIFRDQARITLAAWDEASSIAACADPTTPFDVIAYFLDPKNRRPKLVPALLENPSVPELDLQQLAQEQSAPLVETMLKSPRVLASRNILRTLASNPVLTPPQLVQVNEALANLSRVISAETGEAVSDAEADADLAKFLAEHAQEIATEPQKPFAFALEDQETAEIVAAAGKADAEAVTASAAAAQRAATEKTAERLSPLQKISRLTVGERIQLAMKGNKEERFILVRDGAKLVSSAVLESSKLTEQEVETFAGMKNVQESVLRGIAGKRKFMKQYTVVRALVNNPRCPLDIQLNLAKNLLNQDLKTLMMNKNISETVRKLATKLFKERTEKKTSFGG